MTTTAIQLLHSVAQGVNQSSLHPSDIDRIVEVGIAAHRGGMSIPDAVQAFEAGWPTFAPAHHEPEDLEEHHNDREYAVAHMHGAMRALELTQRN